MTKIPVGKTIAHAYKFTFGNAGTLLRALWLPLLAQLVVAFFILRAMAVFIAAVQAKDPSAPTLLGPLLLLVPLGIILFFTQLTTAMEIAMGIPPQGWFHFPVGRKMWRLLGAFLTAALAIVAIGVVGLLAVWLIGTALDVALRVTPGSRPVVAILAGLLVAAYGYSLFFFAVRFFFLLAPINLSGPSLGVLRTWRLSAGNFWRSFIIILAIAIPISLLNWCYQVAIAGFPPVIPGATKEVAQAAEIAWRLKELNSTLGLCYFTLPVMAALMLFQFGVGSAAATFAWRALTEGEASSPVAAD